jgi:hypothetical protein
MVAAVKAEGVKVVVARGSGAVGSVVVAVVVQQDKLREPWLH